MFKHLERYVKPDCYAGKTWYDYFVFLGQNRDSDTLTRSNFIEGLKQLGGESDTIIVVRENHWACGWIEWIAIHESNKEALNKAEKMLAKIDSYPVLNENAFSDMENDEYLETWQNCYENDFAKDLQKAFKLRDSTMKFFEGKGILISLYEKGIPSGEYFINDNSGISCHIDHSIERLERKDISDFIKEWKTWFKNKAVNS